MPLCLHASYTPELQQSCNRACNTELAPPASLLPASEMSADSFLSSISNPRSLKALDISSKSNAGGQTQQTPACQHTSACVSIRLHASAYVCIAQHTSAYVCIRLHTSAYVSICQHTSACVAYVSTCAGQRQANSSIEALSS